MKVLVILILSLAACGEFKCLVEILKINRLFPEIYVITQNNFSSTAYSTPVDNGEEVAPSFDAYRDVRLLLQTRQNRHNPQQLAFRSLPSVQNSHFDSRRPLRVLIHGWLEDDVSLMISNHSLMKLSTHFIFRVQTLAQLHQRNYWTITISM